GKITGQGADLLISDDLLDEKEAHSKSKIEYVNYWYSNVYYGRDQNRKVAKRINIMQRLHAMDHSGFIAENYGFKRLVIPIQAVEKNMSTVEFRDPRKPGEFAQPSRYSEEEKEKEYKGLGLY